MVLHRKTISLNLEDDDSTLDTCLTPFSTQMSNVTEKKKLTMSMKILMIMMKKNKLTSYNVIFFLYIYLFPYLQLHNLL